MNVISSLKMLNKNLVIAALASLLMNVTATGNTAIASADAATLEKAKSFIRLAVNSRVLEEKFPQEQANLKKTFIENKSEKRTEEIQDALCIDFEEWVIDDPNNNEIGHTEHFSKCLIRLYSVERDARTGLIGKLHETYLLTVNINNDRKKLTAVNIEDTEKFQYDFNRNLFTQSGQDLIDTAYVCRFDRNDFESTKGIKIPLLNTKIQYKKVQGSLEKLITVETDGNILTGISVVVKENGQIKYLDLLNKEEVATQWGLSGNGHLVFFDYDPNTGSAGSGPRPVPELLNCYLLDDGTPSNMKR